MARHRPYVGIFLVLIACEAAPTRRLGGPAWRLLCGFRPDVLAIEDDRGSGLVGWWLNDCYCARTVETAEHGDSGQNRKNGWVEGP